MKAFFDRLGDMLQKHHGSVICNLDESGPQRPEHGEEVFAKRDNRRTRTRHVTKSGYLPGDKPGDFLTLVEIR